jgi:hypothetical protein
LSRLWGNVSGEKFLNCLDIDFFNAITKVPNPKYLIDQTSFIDLKGKAWDIVESPSAFSLKASEATEAGPMLNELSTQFAFLPRSFRFLSNEGTRYMRLLPPKN